MVIFFLFFFRWNIVYIMHTIWCIGYRTGQIDLQCIYLHFHFHHLLSLWTSSFELVFGPISLWHHIHTVRVYIRISLLHPRCLLCTLFSYSFCNLWVHWWVSDGKKMHENATQQHRDTNALKKILQKMKTQVRFNKNMTKKFFFWQFFVSLKKFDCIWHLVIFSVEFWNNIFFCTHKHQTTKLRSTQTNLLRDRKNGIAYTQ